MALTLVVRPIAALIGLFILVLMSRHLSSFEYGIYFAFWALVEIMILASSFGLMHAAYRYVSATEWSDGRVHLEGPIMLLLTLRFVLLFLGGCLLVILGQFFEGIGALISANSSVLIFWVACCTLAEGFARFLEVLFDSMLFHVFSVITVVTRTITRFLCISYVIGVGKLDLLTVLQIELMASGMASVVGLAALTLLYQKSQQISESEKGGLSVSRMSRFVLPAYINECLGAGYGPDALKLAASAVAGTVAIAAFGFAYSIAAVVQRYMPANILAGVFRPVFVAASKRQDASKQLSLLFNLSVKINWYFLLSALCFVFFAGAPLADFAAKGKYPQTGVLTFVLILGMVAMAWHFCVSAYCLAMENSWPPLIATVCSLLGLPIAIALVEHHGAVGIAAAFGISEVIWSVICTSVLHFGWRQAPKLAWVAFFKLAACAVFCIFTGYLAQFYINISWWALAVLSPCMFLTMAWWVKTLSPDDVNLLAKVLPLHKLPFPIAIR